MINPDAIPEGLENAELYGCYYCASNDDCEYAWDDYNEWKTVEQAKHENCLSLK